MKKSEAGNRTTDHQWTARPFRRAALGALAVAAVVFLPQIGERDAAAQGVAGAAAAGQA